MCVLVKRSLIAVFFSGWAGQHSRAVEQAGVKGGELRAQVRLTSDEVGERADRALAREWRDRDADLRQIEAGDERNVAAPADGVELTLHARRCQQPRQEPGVDARCGTEDNSVFRGHQRRWAIVSNDTGPASLAPDREEDIPLVQQRGADIRIRAEWLSALNPDGQGLVVDRADRDEPVRGLVVARPSPVRIPADDLRDPIELNWFCGRR